MTLFNESYFESAKIEECRKTFQEAQGFPHAYFDGVLSDEFATSLADNFPTHDQMRRHYEGLNEKKSEGSNFDKYHDSFQQLRDALGSEKFLKWLEAVTGIDGLIIPDDFRGAGVHKGENGSFLDIHVDFSVHPVLDIHRRLNVLFFMNKDWKEEYGGALELWDENVQNMYTKIYPTFNRIAMFATSDISYHGYGKITVPEDVHRNSFFSYFYTEIDPNNKPKYHDTIFKARPDEGAAKKIKTDIKEGGKNFIKGALRKLGVKSFFKKYE